MCNVKIEVFGGAGGSNPSLLKSAILFLICVGFTLLYVEPNIIQAAINDFIGGTSMLNHTYSAVMFKVILSLFSVLSAVTAGLAANGVAPHL